MRDVPAACAEFAEDLSALLDGELAPERESAVRAHIDRCEDCNGRLATLARVDLALASAPLPAVPANLLLRLDARIAGEQAAARPPRAVAAERCPAPRGRRRWLGTPALGLAAAAALALYLVLRPTETTLPGAAVEETRMAERRPVEPPAVSPESSPVPPRSAPPPAPPQIADTGGTPDPADTEVAEPSDAELEELALVLELDTIEDLDVIANLDLLERLVALEAEASG